MKTQLRKLLWFILKNFENGDEPYSYKPLNRKILVIVGVLFIALCMLTVYFTLDTTLVSARVSRLVYGAPEPKFGAVQSILDVDKLSLTHRFDVVSGVLEDECRQLLVDFFAWRREEG